MYFRHKTSKTHRNPKPRHRNSGTSHRSSGIKQFPRTHRLGPQPRTEPRSFLRQPFHTLTGKATIKPRPRTTTPLFQRRDKLISRIPMLGIRSQYSTSLLSGNLLPYHRSLESDLKTIKHKLTTTPSHHSTCETRQKRRQTLFSLKIAGKGKKRSPGTGGTYRKTPDSNTTCRSN